MEEEKQGAKAARAGKRLENKVERHLNSLGVFSARYCDWSKNLVEVPEGVAGILLKNAPYIKFNGKNGKGEFILIKYGKLNIRIECRYQGSKGSVDDKLLALHANAAAFEERHVILVVEGEGFDEESVAWLKRNCAAIMYKKILVVTFEEFKEWSKIYFNVSQEKENENEETLNNGRQEQDQQPDCNEQRYGYPINRQGARPNRPNRKLIIGKA